VGGVAGPGTPAPPDVPQGPARLLGGLERGRGDAPALRGGGRDLRRLGGSQSAGEDLANTYLLENFLAPRALAPLGPGAGHGAGTAAAVRRGRRSAGDLREGGWA
jgi:hypothetical protein